MRKINVLDYKPEPHPMKQILRDNNITQGTAANYLGVSLSSLSHWMTGIRVFPSHHEERLRALINSLK